MKCIPCRMTFQGRRYHIAKDGTVTPVIPVDVVGLTAEPVSPEFAADIRREASRQRRNRNARDKHKALTSLGLVRVKGALGGTYYE